MKRIRALQSVLQYVPDGSRAEGANVGVVLFVPEPHWAACEISPTCQRVFDFFKPKTADFERIRAEVVRFKSFVDKLKAGWGSEEDFVRFTQSRAETLRLTNPRPLAVHNKSAELTRIYSALVGDFEQVKRERKSYAVDLPSEAANIFQRLEARRLVWRPGQVKIPATTGKMSISYAYMNGRLNLVSTETLAEPKHAKDRLPKLATNGLLLFNHQIDDRDGNPVDAKLVVVSSDVKADAESEATYRDVLKDFQVKFVPYAEANLFAAEVAQTAHN